MKDIYVDDAVVKRPFFGRIFWYTVSSKKAQKFNLSELFNELRRKGRAIKLKCFQSG